MSSDQSYRKSCTQCRHVRCTCQSGCEAHESDMVVAHDVPAQSNRNSCTRCRHERCTCQPGRESDVAAERMTVASSLAHVVKLRAEAEVSKRQHQPVAFSPMPVTRAVPAGDATLFLNAKARIWP